MAIKLEKLPNGFWYAAGGLVVLGALIYYTKKGATAVVSAVGTVAHDVNPLNNDNIFNTGFNSIYQAVTGSNGSMGSDIYDWTHSNPVNGPGANGAPSAYPNGQADPKQAQNQPYAQDFTQPSKFRFYDPNTWGNQ